MNKNQFICQIDKQITVHINNRTLNIRYKQDRTFDNDRIPKTSKNFRKKFLEILNLRIIQRVE